VQLTEGFMMDPEPSDVERRETTLRRFNARRAESDETRHCRLRRNVLSGSEQHQPSVSALVFHHPDCTYFGVGDVSE
jgi:hypothetical protein